MGLGLFISDKVPLNWGINYAELLYLSLYLYDAKHSTGKPQVWNIDGEFTNIFILPLFDNDLSTFNIHVTKYTWDFTYCIILFYFFFLQRLNVINLIFFKVFLQRKHITMYWAVLQSVSFFWFFKTVSTANMNSRKGNMVSRVVFLHRAITGIEIQRKMKQK